MDLTPETLRSATFRDKMRGYHPDDVDEFLESVARGLEVLLARLRDATEKARTVAPPRGPVEMTDEAVRTLALAQKTADRAMHEAETEAERLLRSAEQTAQQRVTDAERTAQLTISDAEDSAVQLAESAQAELRADLERLRAAREQLSGDVNALTHWLESERGRIRRALVEVADRVGKVPDTAQAPPRSPITVPVPPRQKLDSARAAGTNVVPPSRQVSPAPSPEPAPAAAPQAEPVATVPAQTKPAPARPTPTRPTPTRTPPPEHAVSQQLAPEAPPVDRERTVARPPVERPKAAAAPPVAAPAPQPPRQVTPPGGQPAVRPKAKPPTVPRQVSEPSDAAVLNRAQVGMAASAPTDDDPFFAELRAAMLDETPLGPREDDESGNVAP